MAILVSAGELREDLTALGRRIHYGEVVIVGGRVRPLVTLRRFQKGDQGRRVPMTHFRRQLHQVLREAREHPVVVTEAGAPYFRVGPSPASAPDPLEQWIQRMQEEAGQL